MDKYDKTLDEIPQVITKETCKPCSNYKKCDHKSCPLYRLTDGG
jgi:hypothetical protein